MSDEKGNPLFEGFQPAGAPASNIEEAFQQLPAQEAKAPKNGRKKKQQAKPKAAAKSVKPAKQQRKAPAKKSAPAPKFDMLRILKATAGLKESDMAMFESLAGAFTAMGKSTRSRILPAISKLFE